MHHFLRTCAALVDRPLSKLGMNLTYWPRVPPSLDAWRLADGGWSVQWLRFELTRYGLEGVPAVPLE